MNSKLSTILLLFISVVLHIGANAQQKVSAHKFGISGLVADSLSKTQLSYVNIQLAQGDKCVLTDGKGRFNFYNVSVNDTVIITSLGYNTKRIPVSEFQSGKRKTIFLSHSETQLEEIVVTTKKKQKYSKKNNPAVDLMESIRQAANRQNPEKEQRYSYDKYEKIVLSLNDFDKEKSQWLSKRLSPIEDYIDTALMTNKTVLNISVREKYSKRLFTSAPRNRKEIVKGYRSFGMDDFLNQENIQVMLEDVLREVDIYKNDITLMQNRFVSPLSRIAADYYKFYLGDTIVTDSRKAVELIFLPHNPESFSFNGTLYVDVTESEPFIYKVEMRIPKALNLNYVNNIFIEQTYHRDYKGKRQKEKDRMGLELQLVQGVQGFYAGRETYYSGFSYAKSPDYDEYMSCQGDLITLPDYDIRTASFWNSIRPFGIPKTQENVAHLSERMNKSKALYWGRKIISLLVTGYVPTGKDSKFDIGPLNTMFSANSIEGARFRLGGMTTAALNPHLFARGFAAYGTKDHKWKYNAELEYSFTKKKKHSREFPMHSFRLESSYDLDMIGQHYLFTNADNIFLSLKRKENNLGTYRLQNKFSYFYENVSGFSITAGLKAERQTSTSYLPFVDAYGNWHKHYNQTALFCELRYSPGQKFVQMASYRLPVNMDAWVFRIYHEYGPQGFLGADFTTNKTEVSIQKRFWFSAFGYVDCILKGGKIWSQVQYPALTWPNSNLSYTIQPESYSLLNPMEFASDTYAEWDITYWLNGALFNRIPGLNTLKLREVINFKGLWGRLSDKNNPEINNNLFRFPVYSFVSTLDSKPYMELSAGIDNIFTFLRVDYVWRLSYRNTPNAPNSGLRIALHFTF